MRSSLLLRVLIVLALAAFICVGIALFRIQGDTKVRTAAAASGASGDADAKLDAVPADARASITDQHPARTRIHVVAVGTNEPIAGASIDVLSLEAGDLQLVTDDRGFVRCDPAVLQEARLDIRAEGWCAAQYDVPPTVKSDLQFALCAAGDVAVHVRDESGKPMPNMQILPMITDMDLAREVNDSIQKAWPNWVDMKTQPLTDLNGDRLIKDMPRGFELAFSANVASARVTLDATTPVTPVEIVVDLQRCFTGRLVWEDGSIVKDILRVNCVDTPDPTSPYPSGVSQKDGRFEVCGVPKGRFNWKVVYPGEKFRVARVDSESLDVGDIVVHRAVKCSGRVHRNNVPPDFDYKSVIIQVLRSGADQPGVVWVHADGKFEFTTQPGPVSLSVLIGGKPACVVEAVSPFSNLVIDLDAYAGMLRIDHLPMDVGTNLVIELHEAPNAWSPKQMAGSRSRAFWMLTSEASARWCGSSVCIRDVGPGSFDVFALDRGREQAWSLGHVITVAGQEVVLDAALVRPGAVHAHVIDSLGKPMSGIEIQGFLAVGTTWEFPRRTVATDDNGNAAFEQVPIGRWLFYPKVRGPWSESASVVDVTPDGQHALEFVFPTPGRIVGKITYGKRPAPNVSVGITPSEVSQPDLACLYAKTDETGRFQLDHLIPGRYALGVWRMESGTPKFRVTSRKVEVAGDAETRCDVDLDAGYRKLVFQRGGKPFDGFDDGFVNTPDGSHSIERRPELDGEWGASIRSGPCLFGIYTKDVPKLEEFSRDGFFAAVVSAVDTSSAPIVVDLHGGRIDVHPAYDGVILPRARLQSMQGFDTRTLHGDWYLPHEDAGDVRTYTCLPVGCTVLLESDPRLGGPLSQREVRVTSEATLDVTWPPQ